MDEIIIKVWETDQGGEVDEDGDEWEAGGYMYEVYADEEGMRSGACIDGGICTGTMADALGMAVEAAKEIIGKRDNQ